MEYLAFSLIKIIVTIGLLLGSAIILLRYYLTHKKQPLQMLPQNEEQKIILPLRLQACERLVLYLDRIAVNNLIARINKPEMNAHQLQAAMVGSIREEFRIQPLPAALYFNQILGIDKKCERRNHPDHQHCLNECSRKCHFFRNGTDIT